MRKIVLIFGIALLAVSCSTLFISTSSNVRKLEIGMSERQVTDIMGNDYSIVYADYTTRVLGYLGDLTTTRPRERYILTFTGGKLATIETTLDPFPVPQPNTNVGVGVQIP